MVVTVDIEKLVELKLTPDQYIICYLILMDNRPLLNKLFLNKEVYGEYYIEILVKRDYLLKWVNTQEEFNIDNYYATALFSNLIHIDNNDAFDMLRKTYPSKDGDRPLQGDLIKCKKKYLSIIKNNTILHENILKCIEREKQNRLLCKSKGGFVPPWKMLQTYINQKGWELYGEERKDEGNVEKPSIYGGEIK